MTTNKMESKKNMKAEQQRGDVVYELEDLITNLIDQALEKLEKLEDESGTKKSNFDKGGWEHHYVLHQSIIAKMLEFLEFVQSDDDEAANGNRFVLDKSSYGGFYSPERFKCK